MIRSQTEYREACRRLDRDREVAARQNSALIGAGLSPDEVERAMQPLRSFQAQLEEEIAWYDAARAGRFPRVRSLTQIGRLLVALRLGQGLTQRDLAGRLGVSESVVSRDERNEYHGITLERAQKIITALGAPLVIQVEGRDREPVRT